MGRRGRRRIGPRWPPAWWSLEPIPGAGSDVEPYFLSERGIRRDDVMKIPDVDIKAEIEAAMDERRTGEDGYRAWHSRHARRNRGGPAGR